MSSVKAWKWVAVSLRRLVARSNRSSSGNRGCRRRELHLERLDARYLLAGDGPIYGPQPLPMPPDADANVPSLYASPGYGPQLPPWQAQAYGSGSGYAGSGNGYAGSGNGYAGSASGYAGTGGSNPGYGSGYPGGGYPGYDSGYGSSGSGYGSSGSGYGGSGGGYGGASPGGNDPASSSGSDAGSGSAPSGSSGSGYAGESGSPSGNSPEPLPPPGDSSQGKFTLDALGLEKWSDETEELIFEPLPATVKEGERIAIRAVFSGPADTELFDRVSLESYYDTSDGILWWYFDTDPDFRYPSEGIIHAIFELYPVNDRPRGINVTESGVLNLRVMWHDDEEDYQLAVENVPPSSHAHASIASDDDEVRLDFSVGDFDPIDYQVRWGDGVVSTATSWGSMVSLTNYRPVTVTRDALAEVGSLYPVHVNASDGDGGELNYLYDKLDLALNDNDDDGNANPDRDDRTVDGENDLVPYSFASFPVRPGSDGPIYIDYDVEKVRVWDSPEKNNLILPGRPQGNDNDEARKLSEIGEVPVTLYYPEQGVVWFEGIVTGDHVVSVDQSHSAGGAAWRLGRILVRTWGIDVDVDSANRQPHARPQGTAYEDWLEDHSHAIGKLVFTDSDRLTPLEIKLPPGLNPYGSPLRLDIKFDGHVAETMNPQLYRLPKSGDYYRTLSDGGWQLSQGLNSLYDIGYDPETGRATLYISANEYAHLASTKREVDEGGSQRVGIQISLVGVPGIDLSDRVQIMPTKTNGFYHVLQNTIELRAAIAAGAVYGVAAAAPPEDPYLFGLRRMHRDELAAMGVPRSVMLMLHADALGGIKAAVYQDMTTLSPRYILAFAGTHNMRNVVVDVMQAARVPDAAYMTAGLIGIAFNEFGSPFDNLVVAGHSLGGGLATQAAIAGNHVAYTFNTAAISAATIDMLAKDERIDEIRWRFQSRFLLVTDYVLANDLLNEYQDVYSMLPKAGGMRIVLKGPYDAKIAELEQAREDLWFPMVRVSPRARMTKEIYGLKINSHKMSSVYFGLLHHLSPNQDIYGY